MPSPWSRRLPMSPSHPTSNANRMTKESGENRTSKFPLKGDEFKKRGYLDSPRNSPSPRHRQSGISPRPHPSPSDRQPSPSPRNASPSHRRKSPYRRNLSPSPCYHSPSPRNSNQFHFSSPRGVPGHNTRPSSPLTRPPLTPPCAKNKRVSQVYSNDENDPISGLTIQNIPSLADSRTRSEEEEELADRYSYDESDSDRYSCEDSETDYSTLASTYTVDLQKIQDNIRHLEKRNPSLPSSAILSKNRAVALQKQSTMDTSVAGCDGDGFETMLETSGTNGPLTVKVQPSPAPLWKRRQCGEGQNHRINTETENEYDSPSECVTPQASNRSANCSQSRNFFPQASLTPKNRTPTSIVVPLLTDKTREALDANRNERSFSFEQTSPPTEAAPKRDKHKKKAQNNNRREIHTSMMYRNDDSMTEHSAHEVRMSQLITEIDEQDQVNRLLKTELSRKDDAVSKMKEELRQAEDKIAKLMALDPLQTKKEMESYQEECALGRTSDDEDTFKWISMSLSASNPSGKSSVGLESIASDLLGDQHERAIGEEESGTPYSARGNGNKDGKPVLYVHQQSDDGENASIASGASSPLPLKSIAHAQAGVIQMLRKDLSMTKDLLELTKQKEQSIQEKLEQKDEELRQAKKKEEANVVVMEKIKKELATLKESHGKMEDREQSALEEVEKKDQELRKVQAEEGSKTAEIEAKRKELTATKQALKAAEQREKLATEERKKETAKLEDATAEVKAKIAEVNKMQRQLATAKQALEVAEKKVLDTSAEKGNPTMAQPVIKSRSIEGLTTDTAECRDAQPDGEQVPLHNQELQKLRSQIDQEIEVRKRTELEFQSALRARVKETQRRQKLEDKLRSSLSDRAKELEHQLTIEKNLKEERKRSRDLQKKAVALKRQLKTLTSDDQKEVHEKLADALGAHSKEVARRMAAEEKLKEVTTARENGDPEGETSSSSPSEQIKELTTERDTEIQRRKEVEDEYLRLSYDLKKENVRRTQAEKKISNAEERISILEGEIEMATKKNIASAGDKDELSKLKDKLQKDLDEKKLMEEEVSRLTSLLEKEKGHEDELSQLKDKLQKDMDEKKLLEEEVSKIKLLLETEKVHEDELVRLREKLQKDIEEKKLLEEEVSQTRALLEKEKRLGDDLSRQKEKLQKDAEEKKILEKEVLRIKAQLEKEIEQKSEVEEKFTILSVDWAKEVEARMKLEEKLKIENIEY